MLCAALRAPNGELEIYVYDEKKVIGGNVIYTTKNKDPNAGVLMILPDEHGEEFKKILESVFESLTPKK